MFYTLTDPFPDQGKRRPEGKATPEMMAMKTAKAVALLFSGLKSKGVLTEDEIDDILLQVAT